MDQILLNDRYQILQRIGIGGMAYVYEAEDTLLKRRVAVKILKQQYTEDAEFVRKFENEALSAASLSHPHIVNIYDVGSQVYQDRQIHFIVMELIEGSTLKEAIQAQGKMDSSVVARIGGQIAEALQCAHDHNIIHRDIKPANILIMKSGDVKVADFGIARISSSSTVTYTNSILGTVHYISPEQAKGRFTDYKSDIYSLGVVMYEMATGQVPFDADNSVGIAIKHIQQAPIPPRELNEDLAPGLEAIILKCMEKNPADRYAQASDLVYDLKHYSQLSRDDTVVLSPAEGAAKGGKRKKASADAESQPAVYDSRPYQEEEEEDKAHFPWFPLLLLGVALATVLLVVSILGGQNADRLNASQTKVPPVINLKEEEALRLLRERHLQGKVVERIYDDNADAGLVLEQSIKSGTPVDKNTVINLKVSQGKNKIALMDLQNKTQEEAVEALTAAGFQVGQSLSEYSETIPKDRVIRTDPAAGSRMEEGGRVSLIISKGPEEEAVIMPVLIGADQKEGQDRLREAKLEVGKIKTKASHYDSGIIIEQSIRAGEHIKAGTQVDLVISSGPEASTGPNLVDYTLRIFPPENKDRFRLEIFDYNKSQTKPIHSVLLRSADANSSGYIPVHVRADAEADLRIFYDKKPAETSENSQSGEGQSGQEEIRPAD